MVSATGDFPDFTHGVLLLGVDGDGNQVGVLLDSTGQLFAVLRGVDALGDPQSVKVDSDGQLYTVLQGASGVAVAVDADGFITAILKGQHAGEPYTISVDADGRIEAFILDAENQWGTVLQIGNAELAARLGSVVTHDWRGQVLYLCDFSHGLPTDEIDTGSGDGTGILSPEFWLSGGYSLDLTVSSADPWRAGFTCYVAPSPSACCGGSIRFSLKDSPTYVELRLLMLQGTTAHSGKIRLDLANDKLQCYDETDEWQNVDDINIFAQDSIFYSFKVVGNNDTGKYVRALVNDLEFDLSAYDLVDLGAAYNAYLSLGIHIYGGAGQTDGMYVDSFVVTCNEP